MIRKNIVSNYFGALFNIIAPILSVPFYVKYLGMEMWGLVSIILLIQSLVMLFEAALGQSLIREFALANNKNNIAFLGGFFKRVEVVYFKISVFVVTVLFFLSALFYFLGNESLTKYNDQGFYAILLAELALLFQLPASAYRGFLLGTNKHLEVNFITICSIVLKHLGGVLAALFFKNIIAIFGWYLLVTLAEMVARRLFCINSIGRNFEKLQNNFFDLSGIWKGGSAVVIGILAAQMDKIILSSMLSLEDFAKYSIASSVAIGLTQLSYPLIQGFAPKLAIELNTRKNANDLNVSLFKYISILTFFVLGGYFFLGDFALDLWLGATDNSEIKKVLDLLLVGTALNFFYNIGYSNWVAAGAYKIMIRVNFISLIVSVVVIPIMVAKFELQGGGAGWVITNSLCFFLSLGWVKKIYGK